MAAKKAPKRQKRMPSNTARRWVGAEWEAFPRRLKSRIDQSGEHAKDIAARAGVDPSALSRAPQNMSWWSALALAKAMGLSFDGLVAEEPPRQPKPRQVERHSKFLQVNEPSSRGYQQAQPHETRPTGKPPK